MGASERRTSACMLVVIAGVRVASGMRPSGKSDVAPRGASRAAPAAHTSPIEKSRNRARRLTQHEARPRRPQQQARRGPRAAARQFNRPRRRQECRHAIVAALERLSRRIGGRHLTPPQADRRLSSILDCAQSLHTKATVYGTLVGLLNVADDSFGREIVNASERRASASAARGPRANGHPRADALRGRADEREVVAPSAAVELLQLLVGVTNEEGARASRADWFCVVAIDALVLCGKTL